MIVLMHINFDKGLNPDNSAVVVVVEVDDMYMSRCEDSDMNHHHSIASPYISEARRTAPDSTYRQ